MSMKRKSVLCPQLFLDMFFLSLGHYSEIHCFPLPARICYIFRFIIPYNTKLLKAAWLYLARYLVSVILLLCYKGKVVRYHRSVNNLVRHLLIPL